MGLRKIVQGDLLYHSVHGLCQVKEIIKQNLSGRQAQYYSVVPTLTNRMKVRFVIAIEDVEISGFHSPVSSREANEILEYLKMRDGKVPPCDGEAKAAPSFAQANQTWALAKAIRSCSRDKSEIKDQRKRQMLVRSARGLIRELAFVLELTVKETEARVRKSLKRASRINPLVLAALAHAVEDE